MRHHEGKLRAVVVTTTHQIDELLKVRTLYMSEHQTLLARLQSLDQSAEAQRLLIPLADHVAGTSGPSVEPAVAAASSTTLSTAPAMEQIIEEDL